MSAPEADEINEFLSHVIAPYYEKRSAFITAPNGHYLGVVGELKRSVAKSLKLPVQTAAFEVALIPLGKGDGSRYEALSRFPKVEQDISLKVAKDQAYQPVFDELLAGL
jgi:phenylalanyl-tRNA synthetase beta subunit